MSSTIDHHNLAMAGWPLRKLDLPQFQQFLTEFKHHSTGCWIELSKDFIRHQSLKKLAKLLKQHQPTVCIYAGTTDFCSLSGMSESDYFDYLAIQFAEARFLGCNQFRVLIGDQPEISDQQLLQRLAKAQQMLADIELVIETHGGRETDLTTFQTLTQQAGYRFVIDISNIKQQDTIDYICKYDISSHISYLHLRNLDSFVENQQSLALERHLLSKYPQHKYFFEPKTIDSQIAIEQLRQSIRPVAQAETMELS